MKLSEQWLREWVSPPLTTDELADQLTMAGFEVEGIESCAGKFKSIVVGRIEQVEAHPDADKLSICQVDTGAGIKSIVCGASNVAAGKCFPLALPGAILPDGQKIEETVLKGIASAGMLCSGAELGLSSDDEQLIELHGDAEPGADLAEYLRLDDHVIELSLTPNRGDCLSLAGIAREVGVLNNLPVQNVEAQKPEVSHKQSRSVVLEADSACPRYAGRILSNIDITSRAPDWIVERLRRADIRSINVVVDLTNYVMLELGQPMHAFDNDKLSGDIVVRYAKNSEELTLLDGQQCSVQEQTLLITDDSGAIALAGIMGGLDTAVSDETQNLFLESAYFDPELIAGRARSYGLHTDASHRYERGVDFQLQEPALERLTELLIEYCGGSAGPLISVSEPKHFPPRPPVELSLDSLSRVLGIDIEAKRVKQMLEQLDLGIEEVEGGFQVNVPSFRFDISIEADLIEEVARIYGYNNMPSEPPRASLSMNDGNSDSSLIELQQCLLNRGYHEVITYSFLDKQLQEKVLGEVAAISLLNPISSDLGVMRRSLLPGLLGALAYNLNRQQDRIRLFECGRIFEGKGVTEQELMLSGVISGNIYEKQWDNPYISSNIYDLKSDLQALVQTGIGKVQLDYRSNQHPALHPGQSAEIFIENQSIGLIGALHPALIKELDLNQHVFVFELKLSEINVKKPLKFTKISKFPTVKRDISLLVDRLIPVQDIINLIKSEASELLTNLELFDLYQGEGIDIEKKSLALGLTFQTSSSTLTEEEIETVMDRILIALKSEFGATLRK
jgi:phenylalanyl-tRNA synthetase beta chain